MERRLVDGRAAVIKEFAAHDFARFQQEARILSGLNHPNIIRLLDHGRDGESAWLALAHEDGQTLDAVLDQNKGKLDEEQIHSLLSGLLDALDYLHVAGILHRDIKPSNIMIRPDGSPVLLDFGAALPIGDQSEDSQDFSELTPGYAPPEQYKQGGGEGPWTDIYALAATLYIIVTGTHPLDALLREDGAEQISAEKSKQNHYSLGLLKAIDWALKLEPCERPSSVTQWKEELGMAPAENNIDDGVPPTVRIRRLAADDETPPLKGMHKRRKPNADNNGSKMNLWKIGSRLAVVAALTAGGLHVWPILVGWSKDEWVIDAKGGGDAKTIGEAVALARDGAILHINPGIYPESLTIVSPVHLVGAGETSLEVVIAPKQGSCMLVTAESGSVSKLSLIGAGNKGTPCLDIAGGGFKVENTRITSTAGPAVQIRGMADPTIRGNRVMNVQGPGFMIKEQARGAITDNSISLTTSSGIIVKGAAAPLVASNRIDLAGQAGILVTAGGRYLDNVISGSGKSGIEVRGGGDPVFVGNRIEASKEAGIYIHSGGRGLYGRNRVTANAYSGVVVGPGGDPLMSENNIDVNKQHGVLVLDGGKGGFKKNTVENNKAHGFAIGLKATPKLHKNRASGNRNPQTHTAKAPVN